MPKTNKKPAAKQRNKPKTIREQKNKSKIKKSENFYFLQRAGHDNCVRFSIGIETSKPKKPIGDLLNHCEDSDATVVNISIGRVSCYVADEFRDMRDEEMNECAFVGQKITFLGASKSVKKDDYVCMSFENDKGYFTVKELIPHIVAFETANRPYTKWFGGIDTHHVNFHYLTKIARQNKLPYSKFGDSLCRIHWGS